MGTNWSEDRLDERIDRDSLLHRRCTSWPPGRVGTVLLVASVLPFVIVVRAALVAFLRVRGRVRLVEGSYAFGQIVYYVAAMAVAVLGFATATRIAFLRVVAMSAALVIVVPTWLELTALPVLQSSVWKRLVRFSFPLLLAGVGTFVLQTSDVILLNVIRGAHAVGLYAPVLQTVDLVSLVLYALSTYYLPIATRIVAQGDTFRLRSLYATVTKWGLIACGASAVCADRRSRSVARNPVRRVVRASRVSNDRPNLGSRICGDDPYGSQRVEFGRSGSIASDWHSVTRRLRREHCVERDPYIQIWGDRSGDWHVRGLCRRLTSPTQL